MLSALVSSTRTTGGFHRIVLANNGTKLSQLGADEKLITLHVYGHNPPAITNTTGATWTAGNNWTLPITEVYILNAESEDIVLKGVLDTPYVMTTGKDFVVPNLSWEAAIV